jgi:TolA-binding protein
MSVSFRHRIICIFGSIVALNLSIYSQKSFLDLSDERYNKAIELFEKEKYTASQFFFDGIVENQNKDNFLQQSNSAFYSVICGIDLFNNDVEEKSLEFTINFPESPKINDIYFELGKYQYIKKKYKKTIECFSLVNNDLLNEEDQAEFNFKKGYCWLMLDSLDKARKLFYEIKDIDTRYTSSAVYYYSHIAYLQKNYETAITGFTKLKDDEIFSPLVPYYITQIYYFQEKYDDLLAYAPALIDSVVETREAEMARMIADAYYRKSSFKEAIQYYERYFEKGKGFKPQDYYQAGYCYYTTSEYEKALAYLEKSSQDSSQLSQSANYHLGDCYVRLKMKDKALLAFGAASKLNFDLKIKEDATFNYAVLTFDLSNSPFNSSINALSDYITQYPNSRRSDEAYNYLVTACINTHNYQDALTYLEKVKSKDKKIRKAYQRASFFRGLELFNNLEFDSAAKMFDLSLKYAENDPVITSRSYYWLAEVQYRKKNIDEANDNYNLFYNADASKNTSEFKLITYNIAYCKFSKQDYPASSDWFLKHIEKNKQTKDRFTADTYNRLGDCNFVSMKYKEAIDYYSKSIEIGLSDKDYAIFQKAFAIGLQGDYRKKITLLNQLLISMPESGYCDDALFEIGRSEVTLQKPDSATRTLNKLIDKYPSSSYVKKAILQLGLIDYNAGRNDSAIVKYKKVIADYPGTQEAKSSLNGIKNIYVQINDIDTYLKYTETLGDFANVSKAEQDSLMYYSAENLYTSGDCKKAKDNFSKYISKFPEGSFLLNAHFYKGDCHLKAGEFSDALEDYNYVVSKPRNNFSEIALAASARLNMDKKDYNAALVNFKVLDSIAEIPENIYAARLGQTEAYYNLNMYGETVEASKKLLNTQGISQETERMVRYYLAKSYLALNDPTKANEHLKKLAKDVKNKEGAEAKYLIAEILYNQKQWDKAMKEVFNFVDLNTPHQYWIAKAYILLADMYHQKNDDFQAIKTLESIIDNYDNNTDDIKSLATTLKNSIEGKELIDQNSKSTLPESNTEDNEDIEKDL